MIERRRFSRIVYKAPATLTQDEHQVDASIKDLSLHGLLVACDESDSLDLKPLSIRFSLPDSDVTIELVGRIIAKNDHILRVSIEHIDLESISHIKRIVELNVGDDKLLHREIEHLSDLGEHS
ncbi:PilZ domain-containing protein [Vibrio sp. LaRot3]|uniref:PilZ domain-containing protein n=1 Tax=Vibrio sp. LaRot3 TaxID=2998829 RepID=UPI0022CDC3CF|nr:PilZ domain-containing protein [Vibrio sp. LaRot3]MDA0149767.1 PilZ domain-containing protein [Vibrio sp. LaRot3]